MKAKPIEQADYRRKAASGNMKCRTKFHAFHQIINSSNGAPSFIPFRQLNNDGQEI